MVKKTILKFTDKLRNISTRHLIYAIIIILIISLGLASRKYSTLLPFFIAENAGDMFWAMMVYFGFRFLLIRKRLFVAIVWSFLFSFGIEFSQLYQSEWINLIRSHFLGALILGKGFLFADLIRYSVGIIISSIIDFLFIARRRNK